MRKDTLGIVLAHGDARNTCARHEPVWLQSCDRLVYFSPIDNCVSLPGRAEYSVGKSAAYSAHTNQRCREALRFASLTGYEFIMLIEYDSVVFGEWWSLIPGKVKGVAAPVFRSNEAKFVGKMFLHFPQIYRRSALAAVVAEMDKMPLDAEHGFTDRYVGLAVERSHIPVMDLNGPLVFTRNHIDAKALPEAVVAYSIGARWSHGIKDANTFETLSNTISETTP